MRVLVLADFNVANLAGYLQNDAEAPGVNAEAGPFGQVTPLMANEGHACWHPRPDAVVVWTRPDSTIAGFSDVARFRTVAQDEILAEVDRYAAALRQLAARVPLVLTATWAIEPAERGLGMLDMRPGVGIAATLMRMNLRLAEALAPASNVYLLDAQRWLSAAGPRAVNAKTWYLGKIAFDNAVFKAAVSDIKAALRGSQGKARKLLIVDADDTLWGGIVGDVGWQNLRLGGHDAQGEAFVDFQRRLRALKDRGIVLGLVSKNEESVVLEALEQHPEMILKPGDFAGWRINWQDKAANIAELTAELNLGLDSVVFLDDHPVERARVRDVLPDVEVPELPADTLLYPDFLRGLRSFDAPALTAEDASRAESYASERQRKAALASVGSVEDWLRTLEMTVTIEELREPNLERTAQLLNKTNQMNLSTRRMTPAELWTWATTGDRRVWTLRVTDRFGDYGLTGILSVEIGDGIAHVVDFLLSCRVMGRQVEQTMLNLAQAYAVGREAQRLEARVLPTPKNVPVQRFWQESGWAQPDDLLFVWTPGEPLNTPRGIDVAGMPSLAVTS